MSPFLRQQLLLAALTFAFLAAIVWLLAAVATRCPTGWTEIRGVCYCAGTITNAMECRP